MNHFDEELGQSTGGNYGLLDQQMAIRFIAENCQNIGCDPEKITVFGESAGGESTSYHTLSSESSSLISTIIVQSGAAVFDLCPVQD